MTEKKKGYVASAFTPDVNKVLICVETIQKLKEIPGVRGIHIMAIEWEEKVAEIAKAAGLLPRPIPNS